MLPEPSGWVLEFLTDELISEVANEAVSKTAILFQAVKPKGGEMPVVMGAGGSASYYMSYRPCLLKRTLTERILLSFLDQLNKRFETNI